MVIDQQFTVVVTLIGAMGVIASMVFIGWQMRQSTHQRRVGNAIAGTSSLWVTFQHLHAVQRVFIDQPQLRPYFSDGKRCPRSSDIRYQVETVADMFADVLEIGLSTNEKIPSTDSADDWLDYSIHMLEVSPTILQLVLGKPSWWPRLAMLARLRDSAGLNANSGALEVVTVPARAR